MSDKRIIEINGVKLELDMRNAEVSQVDTFKAGDNVKVLVKEYGDSMKIYPGVIVGFDNFKSLPTIIVAHLEINYNDAVIKYDYINAKSEVEIVRAAEGDVPFERARVLELLDRDIEKKEAELHQAKRTREMFLTQFGSLFAAIDETVKNLVEGK